MTVRGEQILRAFEQLIPKLSPLEREKLLSFGEGLAFMADRTAPTQPPQAAGPRA